MSDDYSTPPFQPLGQVKKGADRPGSAGTDSDGIIKAGSKSSKRNVSFMPAAAIAYLGQNKRTAEEERTVIRARLGQLATIYALLFGMTLVLRPFLLGVIDPVIALVCGVIFALLMILALALAFWQGISVAALRILELAMTAMLDGLLILYLYRRLVERSLADDPVTAQMVEKNAVLLLTILILFHGIFVPKSFRRALAVGVPLALSSLATVLVSYWAHPDALGWVSHQRNARVLPAFQFGMDTVFLLLLAAVAAGGAYTYSRLRRQLAEARWFGQYRLKRQIGSGGMGDVYLAEHQLLKRACAIKLIRSSAGLDRRALERFEREVRITATLSHWNTVEIFDYGRTEDGTYYYVMEYLPGLSLAELVERHGPLPPGRVVYLLRQVCLALHEAHGAGLIHRDIKPSNIFAAHRGGLDDVAKLLDFGLVRPLATIGSAEMSGAGPVGTPAFMSPEQILGEPTIDARSDIYSLGGVAYYLLTGQPPFPQRSGMAALIAHVRDPVVPLTELRSDIPADLAQIVLGCLAKEPVERPANVDAVERALGQCACAGDWDKDRASRWWQAAGEEIDQAAAKSVSRQSAVKMAGRAAGRRN